MKVYYGKDIDKRVMRNIVGTVKGNLRFGEGCVKGDDGDKRSSDTDVNGSFIIDNDIYCYYYVMAIRK